MNAAGETVREMSYYPFGLVNADLSSADTTGYDFLFTGKEWIGELGIDLYDYGARYLDPELGRWGAVDPMAEKYVSHSPYNGILNNPFNGVDLFGMEFIHRDPHNNAEETIKILNFINYWEIQGNPKIEWYTAIWDYLDADGKLPNRVRIGNTFSILIEAPCYGMGTPSPQYELQDPWEAYVEAVNGAVSIKDNSLYNLSGEIRLAMAVSPPRLGLPRIPDAISIELKGSAGAVVATNTSPVSVLFKLNRNINGAKVKSYFQGSVGVGAVSATADVLLTQYFIIGSNATKVTMRDFNGIFYSGNIGIDVGISLGAGVSWSSPLDGAYIIGISSAIGVGVSPTVLSGGLYWGQMDFYSNHMN